MSSPGVRVAVLGAVLALSACGLFGGARQRDEPPAIDLNTASLRKLETLPGVTPSMAKRIADGRPYRALDDLVERDILTEREFDRIRDRIVVQDGK
jgi:DNA uptake protein ComE-like DNA-binding protein